MRSEGPALLPVFRSRHQADLLTTVFLHTDSEYTVSDLAGQIGVPLSTLHREVQRLDTAGLLTTRAIGRSRLVRANTAHPAAVALTQLLEVTFGPRVVIGNEFAVLDADKVLIFGSWAARYAGEQGPPPRDVDVLVIGDVDRGDVYDAADRAQERLGIDVNPVIRTREQWNLGDDRLVDQILASPQIIVTHREAIESADAS